MPREKLNSYEDPIEEPGLQLTGTHKTAEDPNISTHYNEADEEGDDALFRDDAAPSHEEHMITLKEDSWFKTIAGVAGNVLEWYE
jgi:hypothetical protein